LNDRVVPFYDQHEVKLSRMLTESWFRRTGQADKVDRQDEDGPR
jgi:hypothetical protein